MNDFSLIPNYGDLFNGQTMMPDFGISGVGSSPAAFGQNFFNSRDFGLNAGTIGFGLQGLSSLGNLWGAFQSNKLARDQLNFTKNFAQKNLQNQTTSYNTALEDRARSRGIQEGQSSEQVQAYIDRNRLTA